MIRLVLAAGLLCSFIVFCDEAETTDSVTERDSVSQAGIAQDTGSTTKKAPEKKKKPSGKVNRILECAYNNKRFDGKKWLKDDHSFPAPGPPGHISRYDRLIKKMSRRFGFDWRLIAAQIYAESRFDTTAKSHVGAKGLMQIMPRTAKHLGTDPLRLHIPEVNVATGCLYDKRMVTLWKRNVDHPQERLAFALASYNAGRGRVLRSFVTDSLETWELVHPLLPGETQDYVHRIALKYDFYKRHALP